MLGVPAVPDGFEIRVTRVHVIANNKPLDDDSAWEIRITDEGTGEFVTVEQIGGSEASVVRINPEEWSAVRAAIDWMISQCREESAE